MRGNITHYFSAFEILPLLFVFINFWLLISAEEECMRSQSVYCFDCNSWDDKRCAEPFNWTHDPKDMPPLERCEGCCVKIVQNYKTSKETVRRTCTQQLQVNLFMVDHVCMLESNGKGHMCFCEEDMCNAATPSVARKINQIIFGTILLLCLLISRFFDR